MELANLISTPYSLQLAEAWRQKCQISIFLGWIWAPVLNVDMINLQPTFMMFTNGLIKIKTKKIRPLLYIYNKLYIWLSRVINYMYNYSVLKYYKMFQEKKNYKITSSCGQKKQINTTEWFFNIKKSNAFIKFFFFGWKHHLWKLRAMFFNSIIFVSQTLK